ncbi:MAG: hypothetical protein WAW86_02835 [Gammaproteobacteria bacterium]
MQSKSGLVFVTSMILSSMLFGCASTQHLDYGVVLKEQKVSDMSYQPGRGTLVGAGTGAGVGAGMGAVYGALVGVTAGSMINLATGGLAWPLVPAYAVGGAVVGATYGSLVGGAVGAGTGYASDIYKQGDGVYQLTIKPDNATENLTITQYASQPILVKSRVEILMKGDKTFVESLN